LHLNRQAFPVPLVDYRQHPEASAIEQTVVNEINHPTSDLSLAALPHHAQVTQPFMPTPTAQ
jgi:hypothetical protein